jgi:putative transposase
VPQVECCRCGASGSIPFQAFKSRQRWWDDLGQEIRRQSVLGLSLREIQENVSVRLGSSVSLRSINQRVHAAEPALAARHEQAVADVPPVVRVDGLWVKLMVPTEQTRINRTGRRRQIKTIAHIPILAAQGVWPATGRQEIIAWTIAAAEDRASWEQLLNLLLARGVSPERGLQLLVGDGSAGLKEARQTVLWDVPFQRCIFHKLRNIWDAIVVPEGLSDRGAKHYRRRLIRSAARLWQAPTEEQARDRHAEFCERWQQGQPEVVATLNRDFDETLIFYPVLRAAAAHGTPWPARALRTTSPLEREFRAWRKRVRSAVLFHSLLGLKAILSQFLFRRAALRANSPPGDWLTALERTIAEFPE